MTPLRDHIEAREAAAREALLRAWTETHAFDLDALHEERRRARWHRWFVMLAVAVMLGAVATREASVRGYPVFPWAHLRAGD